MVYQARTVMQEGATATDILSKQPTLVVSSWRFRGAAGSAVRMIVQKPHDRKAANRFADVL
jgi:hypothetical protein